MLLAMAAHQRQAAAVTTSAQLHDGEYAVIGDDVRLDRALRSHFPAISWNTIRRAIRTGKVQLNGVVSRHPSKLVNTGATLRVVMAAPKRRPNDERKLSLPKQALVFVDPHVVVVNKPAGMLSVPDEHHKLPSLQQLVSQAVARPGRHQPPLHIVQRLDASTSGLMVLARTREALNTLKPQFKERSVRRRYLAMVAGRAQSTRYDSYLTEYADGKRKSTRHAHLGKRAVTHVEVVQRLADAALVRCRLETGRTHQIRIQLSEAGHPLLGDTRYGRRHIQAPDAARTMLHAESLGFEHVDGEALDFEAPPPADFRDLLAKLTSP